MKHDEVYPFTEVALRLPPSPVDQGHGNGRHGRREDENLPRAQPGGEARKLLEHVSPSTDWQNESNPLMPHGKGG